MFWTPPPPPPATFLGLALTVHSGAAAPEPDVDIFHNNDTHSAMGVYVLCLEIKRRRIRLNILTDKRETESYVNEEKIKET